MIFTSFDYCIFLSCVFAAYWLIRNKFLQNLLLLVCSYIFYGYIHPWFCILIASSTIVDYLCGLAMVRYQLRKRLFLAISLIFNLGLLGFFKYFNFFSENIYTAFEGIGFKLSPITFKIFLPVGISFYTFQTLSYTIDVYRGKIKPRKSFVDFAVFVALFPQLVAGPIERASHMLPQIEKRRLWHWDMFFSAWPLLVRGYLKKLVIADSVAFYVDKIFMLEHPTILLLAVGSLAFALQIYTDFSAYTDIARGSAKLLGFELMENFESPYLAITPSDFWRHWHISFSSWIRDYLYIPLGGSRVGSWGKYALVLLVSLGLSGLWHGAAWNFITWGVYYAVLLFIYHYFGLSGHWRPAGRGKLFLAWFIMFCLTILGWSIFRASSIDWLIRIFTDKPSLGIMGDSLTVSLVVLVWLMIYSSPLFALMFLDRVMPNQKVVHAVFYGLAIIMIMVLARETGQDFIYFQF